MTTDASPGRRRRSWLVGAGLFAVLMALLLLLLSASKPPSGTLGLSTEGVPHVAGPTPSATAPPRLGEQLVMGVNEQREMIEEVAVDRHEVCVGEPFTIRVKAHNVEGADDGELRVFAPPLTPSGNPLVGTFPVPGDYDLSVTVINAREQWDHRTVKIKVADCVRELLEVDAMPMQDDVFHFVARPRLAPGSTASVTRYRWSFGDGTVEETSTSYAVHSYRDRPRRDQSYSTFLVDVTGTRSDGGTIVGKQMVPFRNDYAINRRGGEIKPELAIGRQSHEGKDWVLPLVASHWEEDPIRLQEADVYVHACGDDRLLGEWHVGASAILGVSELAPGRTELRASLPEHWVGAEGCRAVVHVRGDSSAGIPVDFTIGLPVGALPQGVPVSDDVARRVQQALVILGRQDQAGATVTPEEIERLVREGKLQ